MPLAIPYLFETRQTLVLILVRDYDFHVRLPIYNSTQPIARPNPNHVMDFVPRIKLIDDKVENAATDEERAMALRQAARNIDAQNRTFGGAHRYCLYTRCIKPDRSHYCSGMIRKYLLIHRL